MPNRIISLLGLVALTACGSMAGTSQPGDNATQATPSTAAKTTGVLHALSYSPYHGNNAACPTVEDIRTDFLRMQSLASNVRIYALRDCSEGQAAMAAASEFGMRVNLGLWLTPLPGDANGTDPVAAELRVLGQLLDSYNPNTISMITVGNETQAARTVSAAQVVSTMGQVRQLLSAKQLTIPVTTAQVATDYTPELIAASDVLLPNIHPYWAGVQEPNASAWVIQTAQALATNSNKSVVLGETGWPSAGDTVQSAVPSQANASAYMQQFMCDAAAAGLDYTYFEGFDVTQTGAAGTTAEGHWGVMDGNGTLKGPQATSSTCPTPP